MESLVRSTLTIAAGAAIGLTASARLDAQSGNGASTPVSCEELASRAPANTSIATAETVAPGAFELPGPTFGFPIDFSRLPAFCRVAGSIRPTSDSDIRFELWLPAENRNGRFMQTGNGGAAGSIVHFSLVDPLTRGYAAANTDTGHQGGGSDFEWAIGHPEKLIDFQYRAVHELTVAGKAITAMHYGREADESYWDGCSTGGRQGLLEAQRYPDDYDAIIAGAPANNWIPLMSLSVHIQKNVGTQGLGADKLGALKEAAIAACDAADGVTDRVITDFAQCDFEPAMLQCEAGQSGQCLTDSEVAAAQQLYAGLVGADGEVIMPGTGVGSEPGWAAYAPGLFPIGLNFFRDIVMSNPEWDPQSFDVTADVARATAVDDGASGAMDPDLSAFIENGGKLIMYHGTTDGLIPYGNTVNYYESVVAELGEEAAQNSVKLYLVPGMDHCRGGEGTSIVDWLGAMEQWVEQGTAPDVLEAAHPPMMPGLPGAPPRRSEPFTRPLCAYPEVTRYTGSGDSSDASSFACMAP